LHWLLAAILLVAGMLSSAPAAAQDWIYSARPGDNIWNLTERHLKGLQYWKRLKAYNKLPNPDYIVPGTRLRIPIRWLKVQPTSARLIVVQGQVQRVTGEDGALIVAARGDELRSGDGIRTGAQSSATVEFADRSRLLVHAETDLTMDSMSAYGTTGMVDTSMRLHSGRVENEVEPAAGEASRYRIITPSAVVAVRGTSFRSAFDEGTGVAFGEVAEGALAVTGTGNEQRVPAGFGIRAERGRALQPPVPLLPAPDLSGLPAQVRELIVALAWPAVADAVKYRVQLYPGGDLTQLLRDLEVDSPSVELDAPPDGEYLLRVRGISSEGLEGLNAQRTLVLDARPVPPTLLGPPAEARMAGEPPELWWSIPGDIEQFQLQLARDTAFSDRVVDERAVPDGGRYRLAEEPAPGTYHWRVASISAQGEQGPFSPPRGFTIQAVPDATTASGSVADGEVAIAWGRAANTERYEFQLAEDEAFTELVINETLTETQIALPGIEGGLYFFRVRGVSAEGVAGAYTPVNRLEVPLEPPSSVWLLLLAPLLLL